MKARLKKTALAIGKGSLSILAIPLGLACGAVLGAIALVGITIGLPIYAVMVLWEDENE